MSQTIIFAVIALSGIGIFAALILYFVAQKFKVVEDPRIDLVSDALPGANCGGCGYAGCRNFAEQIVKTESLEGLNCPVGGSKTMKTVGNIMGLQATESEPTVAVVRCNGSKANASTKTMYQGANSCLYAQMVFSGESGCSFGCLGLGDCVESCLFDAIHINPETGLPVVDEEKCTACSACVKACPRSIIELRQKGAKDRRVFVSCVNKEKGAVAKKNCTVACIGCGICAKTCPFDAITVENNLAYIDFEKCKLCRKCVEVCPTGAILEVNFPAKKKVETNNEIENTEQIVS
ncbi:MAG: Fe-S cluster domain-containing protein [Lentimicrobiaceae bacterium]|nr:Fe-S cluster domain-containing protein [Lentimicrobiaceae bacterium]